MVRSNWFFLSFEALSIGTQVCIPRLHWNDTFSDFLTTLVWRNSKSSNITLKWLHLCKVSLGVKLLWFVGNGHRPRISFILLEVINQNVQNSTCQLTFHLGRPVNNNLSQLSWKTIKLRIISLSRFTVKCNLFFAGNHQAVAPEYRRICNIAN